MDFSIFIPIFVGLVSAYLVNYLADVLPTQRKLGKPTCPQCDANFNGRDYLLLRRCASCGKPRAARAWATLIALAGLSVYLWFFAPKNLGYGLSALIIAYFAVIFIIDLEQRLILHVSSYFGMALMALIGWKLRGVSSTLLGGIFGFGFMLALYYLGVYFARYRARKMQQAGQTEDDEEALGFGDVMLGGVLGLLLGARLIWSGLLQGILLAGIFGIFLVLFMLFVRRYKENALMIFMPYGPFLILSAFLTVFVPQWTLGALIALAQK